MVLTQIVMVSIMTMTPVFMVYHGHSMKEVGMVIGIHIGAMYLPSLITGILIKQTNRGKFMAIASYSKFETYKSKIFSLPSPIEEEALRSSQFLLEKDDKKKLEIYYAPFDYVNEQAKIVIVGITPGLHQMKKSYATVRDLRDNRVTDEEILHQVKKNSSFEGPMRKNLIKMLDELQLHYYLGLSSTSELFNTASHLVQTTSIITYPVFYNGKNYNGSTPNLLKTELLKKYVIENFTKELEKLQELSLSL